MLKILVIATAGEQAFLDCHLCTGARRSEIFNLTWDRVNFAHRTITPSAKKTADGNEKLLLLPMNQKLYDSLKWVKCLRLGDRGRSICRTAIHIPA
jgi:integrase